MRYLLSAASRPVLEGLAQERTLCAFDFDGTLSAIVGHPNDALLRVRTRELLAQLSALYPCVILTGRSRKDVLSKLDGTGIANVLGSHGAESGMLAATPTEHIAMWKAALEAALKATPEIWIEDKGLSLAVHYRQYPHKADARRRISEAVSHFPGLHLFGGKEVVNLMETGAPTKGPALMAERDRLGCEGVLFVGDDENDEDAFAIEGHVVPVRVGQKLRSKARYYLRTQLEIDELLEHLVRLRKTS